MNKKALFEKYQQQLNIIMEKGYLYPEYILSLLEKYEGNIETVLLILEENAKKDL